jgi:hypothetical protein
VQLLLIVSMAHHARALTFTLERLQEQCFVQRCIRGQRLGGGFAVEGRADTGLVDVKVRV